MPDKQSDTLQAAKNEPYHSVEDVVETMRDPSHNIAIYKELVGNARAVLASYPQLNMDAEDLVQEATTRLLESRRHWKAGLTLQKWYYWCIRSLIDCAAKTAGRADRAAKQAPFDSELSFIVDRTPPRPYKGTELRHDIATIRRMIKEPELISLLDQLSVRPEATKKDLADRLAIDRKTVDQRLGRLKKIFAENYTSSNCGDGGLSDD